jgi:hypothetical protein
VPHIVFAGNGEAEWAISMSIETHAVTTAQGLGGQQGEPPVQQ